MMEVDRVAAVLDGAQDVAIATHVIPDGDCLGSMLALALALRNQGKRVVTINSDPVPEMFKFLPGSEDILTPDRVISMPEILVIVDSTDMDRIGSGFGLLWPRAKTIINIDHHVSNTLFGTFNMVNSKAAAAAELIYILLEKMALDITPDVATCLYTGLVSDTGSFQYESCTAETMRMAASLMDKGADTAVVREYLWEKKPLSSIQLLGASLSTLSTAYGGKVAWMSVTREMLHENGLLPEYAEGLVNYPRSIDGVEVALLFRELPDGSVKVNLRSKKTVDVNKIAEKFNGGGHQRAAGCTINEDLERSITSMVEAVGEFL